MLRYLLLKTPSAAQLRQIAGLYAAAGWHDKGDTLPLYRKMLKGSHCLAVALERGEIIGMARAISDGANDAYIQDVFVLPARRKTGIGTRLIKLLLARLKKDGVSWIGLIADEKAVRLYESCGFRPMKGFRPMRLRR